MSSYFNQEQIGQLLRAINVKRVSQDGKGFSHVEAYDVRAHCNRLFGFGRWSIDVTHESLLFETSEVRRRRNKQGQEFGDPYEAWTVCYKARVLLTVCAPDGTVLAHYEDAATGEAANQPGRGDAHDLALKTAVSQAFKRAAVNLGDQMGASLYAKGSTSALVRRTLVMPDTEASTEAVDGHITEQLPREDEPAEPAADPRSTNRPASAPDPEPAVGFDGAVVAATGGESPPVAPPVADPPDEAAQTDALRVKADAIREQAIGEVPAEFRGKPGRWIAHLMGQAVKAGVLTVPVESLHTSNKVALKVFLEQALKQATGPAERPRERAS